MHSGDHFFYDCAWTDPWTSRESSTLDHLNWERIKMFLCLRLCVWQVQHQIPRQHISSVLLAMLLSSGCTLTSIACKSLPGLVLNYVHLCRTWSLGSLQPYKIVANKLFCELAVEDYRITPTKFLLYCNRFLHQVWKYTLRSLPLFHNIQNPCYAQAEQKIFSIS